MHIYSYTHTKLYVKLKFPYVSFHKLRESEGYK